MLILSWEAIPKAWRAINCASQGIEITEASDEQWEEALKEAEADWAVDREKVLAAGGLYVLGTERHEARRIDNQLRGRSGRQGDPGESRFFLSLEDELMRRFQAERVKQFMGWANIPEDEPIEHNIISKSIAQAQVRVEGYNFDIRKRVLEYDDVVNKQREFLYHQRNEVMQAEDMREEYLKIIEESVLNLLDEFIGEEDDPDTWDVETIYRQLFTIFPVPAHITPDSMAEQSLEELEDTLIGAVTEAYDNKTKELGEELMHRAERFIMLSSLDQFWRRHLTDLDILREGIGLMAIAQRDPLVEYQRAAFGMWGELQQQIRQKAAHDLLNVRVQTAQQQPRRRQYQAIRPGVANGAAEAKPETIRKSAKEKIGRNDPCWCGSGKKYKQCHMKQDQKERRERMNA